MTRVDVRVLRYFVTVAQERHFTRAAQRLFISQPSLSYAIKHLETELGTALFIRSARKVELTAAGEVLATEAAPLLEALERAVDRTRRAGLGQLGILRVGFEASGAGVFGATAHARFRTAHPDVQLEVRRFDWGGEVDALRAAEVDLAWVWLPADLRGLATMIVQEEQRYVAVSVRHRLASRTSVSILDLSDEPLMWTRRAPRSWVDWWAVNPRPDGRAPIWGPTNDNVEELLEPVAAGQAICIAPRSMAEFYGRPDLAWRPVTDIEPLRIALAWRDRDTQPLAHAFRKLVHHLLANT